MTVRGRVVLPEWIDSQDVGDLLGTLYEASLDASLWPRFLDRVSNLARSGPTSLTVHNHKDRTGRVAATTRLDPEFQRQYDLYFAKVNLWKNRFRDHYEVGTVVNSSRLCSDRELERSEFYADFLRPADMYYSAGPVIFRDGSWSGTLSTQRPKRGGPFVAEEGLFAFLAPHLERAMRTYRVLGQGAASLEILSTLRVAVVVLDLDGQIRLVNESARTLLESGEFLRRSGDALVAVEACKNHVLRDAISQAVRTARGRGTAPGRYVTLASASSARRLQLLVTAARMRCFADPYEPAVLVIATRANQNPVAIDALTGGLDLTGGEARLAAALAEGLRLREAAGRVGMTYETARWYLKQVFQKLHVSRQTDLVQMVLQAAAAHRPMSEPEPELNHAHDTQN